MKNRARIAAFAAVLLWIAGPAAAHGVGLLVGGELLDVRGPALHCGRGRVDELRKHDGSPFGQPREEVLRGLGVHGGEDLIGTHRSVL